MAVAVAYFVGVQIGIALTFRPATTSMLWPPNSILTAALLLVPPRHWWVCLGAALPVHLGLQLEAGMEPVLSALLFVTNCSEALIAAGLIRALSDAPSEFNTLRRVSVFIASAGLAAPILSSFADAAVVHVIKGDDYWAVWGTRTFSNVLTELSVVPLLVRGVASLRRWRRPSLWRAIEFSGLAATIACTAIWVFGDRSSPTIPGLPPTPSVLLLPLYFWAALRFGVGGTSAALFATALVATYEASTGNLPFAVLPPAESLIAVQAYLTIMGMPLMCVAGLLEERRKSAADLRHRLRFEELLSSLAGGFLHQPLVPAFDDGLRRVGEFLRADYVCLLQGADSSDSVQTCSRWTQPAASDLAERSCTDLFPWAFRRVSAGDAVVCESFQTMPDDAVEDRRAYQALGLGSAVVQPLVSGDRVLGALTIATVASSPAPHWEIRQLELIAEVLANACARRLAEVEVQRTRQKLAHMARLSSMGELTASLAHQLNQPLTSILNNANAARRLIDAGRVTIPQLREIVVDIIDDDRRAGDVIRRVREILTRSEWSPSPLDANALVRDVATLIASDAVLRRISLSYDLAPGPLILAGNRTDLEQVLLNVITNAMDAVADSPVPRREVAVQTAADEAGRVVFVIRDRGPGVTAGTEDDIFEPFVTTKPGGMGMGLAVARSLVEVHGGAIRVVNHQEGGAVVTISIPAMVVEAAV